MAAIIAQPGINLFKDELTRLTPSRYKILVSVANPATADDLLDLATALARERKGEVVALHVLASEHGLPPDEERRSASTRRTILEEVVTSRRRSSVPIHTVTRIAATPAEGIIETAQSDGYDLILLGWQGRMRPVSLGSSLGDVLDPVVRSAPCPVAVVKNPGVTRIHRILVPTAGGPNARLALDMGITLARRYKAEVTLLTIAKKGQEEAARRLLERSVQQAKSRQPVRQQAVVADHIVKSILHEARDYDVVILGASHEGVFQQILFGVIPEQIAKRCPKTVIMVKGSQGPLVTGLRRLWSTWSTYKLPLPVVGAGDKTSTK
jgi:nucleotide-binding universal stress UspA family protein